VQEHHEKPTGSVLLTLCLTVLKFGVPFIFLRLLSAVNLRPCWRRLKAASFFEDTYMVYVQCIILFYYGMKW